MPIRRPATRSASTCRIRRSSRRRARAHAAARRRQGAAASPRRRAGRGIATKVEVGGKLSDRKGVSLPDTMIAVLGADREGPLRSRSGARRRGRLDRAVLHAAARGHRRGARRSRAAAPRVMAKIEKPQAVDRLDEIIESPMRSWWRAAISASRCRSRRCRASRSRSPARRAAPASRWWWRPRCSNR